MGINDFNGSVSGSWGEWARYVLAELKRLNEAITDIHIQSNTCRSENIKLLNEIRSDINSAIIKVKESLDNEINNIKLELATLKIKAGIWGTIGASIPVVVWLLLKIFIDKFN